MPIRDYVFRVHGDCIRAGYAYPLLGALKLNDPELAGDQRVFFGSLEGVRPFGNGYLAIRESTFWRARAPSELTDRFRRLSGRKLLIGDHVIRLGELHTESIRPSSSLYAEFIAIKSMHFQKGDRHPTHREFLGWVTDKLRRKYSVCSGKVEVGRRRRLHIGQYPATTGYAVGVYEIDPKVSQEIQRGGLGGRRHMGGALFLPGTIPGWCVGDDRMRFCIARLKPPKESAPMDLKHITQPGSGVRAVLRAELFMRAVRAGRYPSAAWLSERAGISMPTAYRVIRSIRDDLGAPLVYSDADRGWYLTDPKWRMRGL